MAAVSPRTLAELCFTMPEIARGLGRHVKTVTTWFADDPQVIRTPRGGQRDQLLVPISHAQIRFKSMRIPEEVTKAMIEEHEIRLMKPAPPPAPVVTAPISRGNLGVTTAKQAKPAKTKQKIKPGSRSKRTRS